MKGGCTRGKTTQETRGSTTACFNLNEKLKAQMYRTEQNSQNKEAEIRQR
jgi:hypothetical protein